ncbi:FAD-binding protein [Mesobaculum littorinae]|uniref:FAD-binding protein n=1 Tax=Mesobaculum littorinae TaxID=2486419 RepID=A0A438ADX5_9RHOB|nr:FAD-binding protein [Mesobaculum littorinae]RVV96894.1 FAD-binding protein [Mesobaculum littorinae]
MRRPETEADLARMVALDGGPLLLEGGGTRAVGRPARGRGLSVAGISGVTLYEPGALTLSARAGTPLAEIEALLAGEGQRLAFEPMDHRGLLGTSGTPTLGGMVAANATGPRRMVAGAVRDAVLGLRFVTGEGAVVKSGGRVMKNVTGYDLAKLMTGSWGTLGAITEVTLKVLPAPEARATLEIPGLDPVAAVAAMSAALGSPFEVTGAAHGDLGQGVVTLLRLEGFAPSVEDRAVRLARMLEPHGPVRRRLDGEAAPDPWVAVRDVGPFHGVPGDVWRISLRPSRAAEAVARIGGPVLLDWGGGLIWALTEPGRDLRAELAGLGGHARLERATPGADPALATFPPEPAAVARLSRDLRARFDPRGRFATGRMEPDTAEQGPRPGGWRSPDLATADAKSDGPAVAGPATFGRTT